MCVCVCVCVCVCLCVCVEICMSIWKNWFKITQLIFSKRKKEIKICPNIHSVRIHLLLRWIEKKNKNIITSLKMYSSQYKGLRCSLLVYCFSILRCCLKVKIHIVVYNLVYIMERLFKKKTWMKIKRTQRIKKSSCTFIAKSNTLPESVSFIFYGFRLKSSWWCGDNGYCYV